MCSMDSLKTLWKDSNFRRYGEFGQNLKIVTSFRYRIRINLESLIYHAILKKRKTVTIFLQCSFGNKYINLKFVTYLKA